MNRKLEQRSFHHLVYFNQYKQSIEKLMDRLKPYGLEPGFTSMLPTIIHVNLPEDVKGAEVPIFRMFLMGLRDVSRKYFVRFTTNVLWAIESDNQDVFYAKEEYEGFYHNIVIDLKVVNLDYVDVHVKIPYVSKRHLAFKRLARSLDVVIPIDDCNGVEEVCTEAIAYFNNLKTDTVLDNFHDAFYLLFIPSHDNVYLHPILLWGMSEFDAKRKHMYSDAFYDRLRISLKGGLEEDIPTDRTLSDIVFLLQDTLEMGSRRSTAIEAHGHAELLLGYLVHHAENRTNNFADNELIILDQLGDGVQYFRLGKFIT